MTIDENTPFITHNQMVEEFDRKREEFEVRDEEPVEHDYWDLVEIHYCEEPFIEDKYL